jgi:DNA polymerase III epsilon subunit-like protein
MPAPIIWPTRYVAIDLETSGLNSTYDQILQVAVVPMESGQIIGDPYYTRVLPGSKFRISREALETQVGETDGDALKAWWEKLHSDGLESRAAMQGLIDWARDGEYRDLPVVAHNASFDWGFFSQWVFIWRVMCGHRSPLGPAWLCTKEIAQGHEHFKGAKSFSLDLVSQALGLPLRPKGHDALQDAILAGQVYHALTGGSLL